MAGHRLASRGEAAVLLWQDASGGPGKAQEGARDIEEGRPPAPEALTVKQWLETWLRDSVPHTVRPRTAIRYGEIVKLHLVPRLGHIRLAQLQPSDVERTMRQALEAGQSPRSVHHHRAVLRTALNHAIRHGLIARNAASLAKAAHVPGDKRDVISPARAKAILAAVRGHRLEALPYMYSCWRLVFARERPWAYDGMMFP